MSRPPEPGPFASPWEAQVFALVVSLQDAGLFTWSEWSRTLGATIRPDNRAEQTAGYGQWLEALETILAAHGVADLALIEARSAAFERAAAATPHGQPVLLRNDPLHGRTAAAS